MPERNVADLAVPAAEQYATLRNEVKHEDDLIGQRISWFMASQAFLLVSLAIAHKGETDMPTSACQTRPSVVRERTRLKSSQVLISSFVVCVKRELPLKCVLVYG